MAVRGRISRWSRNDVNHDREQSTQNLYHQHCRSRSGKSKWQEPQQQEQEREQWRPEDVGQRLKQSPRSFSIPTLEVSRYRAPSPQSQSPRNPKGFGCAEADEIQSMGCAGYHPVAAKHQRVGQVPCLPSTYC